MLMEVLKDTKPDLLHLMWAVGQSNKTVYVGSQPKTLHVDSCMWVVDSCDETFCVVPAHTMLIKKAWLHTKPPANTPSL